MIVYIRTQTLSANYFQCGLALLVCSLQVLKLSFMPDDSDSDAGSDAATAIDFEASRPAREPVILPGAGASNEALRAVSDCLKLPCSSYPIFLLSNVDRPYESSSSNTKPSARPSLKPKALLRPCA